MPTFRHGKNANFQLDNSAGSIQDLSTYIDEVTMPRSVETGETTTFGVTGGSKTYVVGLNDSTISLKGKWDATLDAHMAAVISAQDSGSLASATFKYGPESSTASRIQYTGECFITSYEVGSPVGDVVTWSAELQVTGAITRTTY